MTDTSQHEYIDAEAIWRDFRKPLLGFIALRVNDQEVAEDILQDVMLRIHRHVDDLVETQSVRGWIYHITRNAIIDHYRRAASRKERPAGAAADLEQPEPLPPEIDPAELHTELTACIQPLLDQLPDIYREALQLTDLQGLTQAEAAAQIGLSVSGMKSRVQRGRAHLRSLFTRCCEIELDRRGGIIDYRPGHDTCNCHHA